MNTDSVSVEDGHTPQDIDDTSRRGNYYVLRFYPDVTTGEFLNIGIVLIDQYRGRIKIAMPKQIASLAKMRWVDKHRIELLCESYMNFTGRLGELSFFCDSGEPKLGCVSYISLGWNVPVLKYISEYQRHCGGMLQLSEPMPCNTSQDDIINMLYNTLVNNNEQEATDAGTVEN